MSLASYYRAAVGVPQPNGGFTGFCPGDSGGPGVIAGTNTQVNRPMKALPQ